MNIRYSLSAILRVLMIVSALCYPFATIGHAATCGPMAAVNPAQPADPQAALTVDYTRPILDANSLQKYVTNLPNPLDPAFIYTASGVQGGEPWYQVSMREINQSVGLIDTTGCTAPPAKVWTYGDARDDGVNPYAGSAPHSFPGPTFEVMSNVPHRVTWTNELPGTHPVSVDPTLDCGPHAPGCFPFNRVVPHVHGAHVADDSDGNPDAWFSANFAFTGHAFTPNTQYGPKGTYRYDNSQEAGTIWYHDHAMGLTHLNVYAGLAGFNIIRDDNEVALQNNGTLPKFPFEVPMAIQDRVFDTAGQLYSPDQPIKNFNATLTNVACDPAVGAVAPYACTGGNAILPNSTPCDPAAVAPSPYACPVQEFTKNVDNSYTPVATGTPGAVTLPSITPEFFGNVALVNGQAWPKLDVEKRVYRFRWLNGSDSRAYILRLVDGVSKQPIPGLDIWQIGTDQALLPNPVKTMVNDPTALNPVAPFPQTNGIVVMPGERVDVLVDFKNVPGGTTSVILQNLGPDGPFTGEYPPSDVNGQLPSALLPELMAFNVVGPVGTLSNVADTVAPAANIALKAVPAALSTVVPPKKFYLAERVDSFGRLALTINGLPYMPQNPPIAIQDLTNLNDVEEWEIYNLTPDAHPMHPHLVSFQVINREDLIDPATGQPYAPPMVLPPLETPVDAATVGLSGTIAGPAANEVGAWKDTVYVPPGTVLRLRAKFDIPGLYVFHCHILSHEENDMMRPYAVTTPATGVTLTSSTVGNSQVLGAGTPVTFTASASTGIAAYPTSNAFEYQFTVTSPTGVVTPLDNMGMMVPGTTAGYSQIKDATWTPPNTPGTYVITVNAKAMGPISLTNVVRTATLNYTVIPIAAPNPLGPQGGGIGANPVYTFDAVPSATGYYIYLWDDILKVASVGVWYTPAQANCPTGVGVCTITQSVPLATGVYRWKVRARNVSGVGPYSAYSSFTIGTPPTAPTLVSPQGVDAGPTPVYTFNAIPGATGYSIYLWDNTLKTGSATVWYTAAEANCPAGIGNCTITQAVPLATGSYQWKARARNSAGVSTYSAYSSFTVGIPPIAPTLVSPQGGGAGATPVYTFNAIPGATGYSIYLWDNTLKTGTSTVWYTAAEANCPAGIGNCTITQAVPLAAGSYKWKARARNAVGYGSYSAYSTFNTQ